MYDLGDLVYLDLNKTGSKFVLDFLKKCSTLHLKSEAEHEPIRESYNPKAFHFITVRHPYSQYSSLFRYGLDGKGWICRRINESGNKHLYKAENFNKWLGFVLDKSNASLLGEGYDQLPSAYELGFLSFRYLRLSLIFPLKTLALYKSLIDPVSSAMRASIVDYVIKNEELNSGLEKFATAVKPEFFHQSRVEQFFERAKKVNESKTKEIDIEPVSDQNKEIIERKEFLLMRLY